LEEIIYESDLAKKIYAENELIISDNDECLSAVNNKNLNLCLAYSKHTA
jgi:hypothetical protein